MNDFLKDLLEALGVRMRQIDALEDRVKALEAMLTTDSTAVDTRAPLTWPKIDKE